MRREYAPEPTVAFFRQQMLISQICSHAVVLDGPLPPHIRALFGVIENGSGEPLPETYPDAVEWLGEVIKAELDHQVASPLTEPSTIEMVRLKGFEQGAAAAIAAATAAVDTADLRGGP